ncbi:MAG TPA: SGNH/GDSL hydrolase family protein, partial [Thermoanaerobaculia bacterium]
WSVTPFALSSGRDLGETAVAIARFNRVNREETAKKGARWVDVTPTSQRAASDRTLLAADGLHPSAAQYATWARLVLPEALAALGAKC